MEPEGSLPCSQELATVTYPEPDESNPRLATFSPRSVLIFYSHLRLGVPIGLFPLGFPTKLLYAFFFVPSSEPYVTFRNMIFCGEELLAPRPTPSWRS
jgi:hypothetical protein